MKGRGLTAEVEDSEFIMPSSGCCACGMDASGDPSSEKDSGSSRLPAASGPSTLTLVEDASFENE